MYSDKPAIQILCSLLKANGIKRIVLCPGSRNAPIIESISGDSFFECYSITDERSAGFVALGLALEHEEPAAVCCTSGSALLNLHSAVSEAFYRGLPFLVISADRPQEWIGQMDGQTLPQSNVFGTLSRKSVNLPEVHTPSHHWYCNRLVNEALLALQREDVRGPVHINIPLGEPLFEFNTPTLPKERKIEWLSSPNDLRDLWREATRKLIIVGQMDSIAEASSLSFPSSAVVIADHLSNRPHEALESRLYRYSEELRPDIVVTIGGNILSKSLKQGLRKYPPKMHWHVSPSGEVADLFMCQTHSVPLSSGVFMEIIKDEKANDDEFSYKQAWKSLSLIPDSDNSKKEMESEVIAEVMKHLPPQSVLHLGNSLTVRLAQHHHLSADIQARCNRGVSGIDGSLSTAVGSAIASDKLHFVLLGDLSFFYDANALWNAHVPQNLRVVILNNGEGRIFETLPGLQESASLRPFVTGVHQASAQGWVEGLGLTYIPVRRWEELEAAVGVLTTPKRDKAVVLEIFFPVSG
ncbi:MAG: 2-succinyl-5-enolpyruvyl-6-hydroxy-3-cyclohexene-1-carboxylic-acid synthase [Porphyromonas sp.]|nr:2-succinyl-5-enolpyruvyl-6-hydroxy-3-cyclohexene-1-carboxylic-acid synthase [Porphyromonas sp.]